MSEPKPEPKTMDDMFDELENGGVIGLAKQGSFCNFFVFHFTEPFDEKDMERQFDMAKRSVLSAWREHQEKQPKETDDAGRLPEPPE